MEHLTQILKSKHLKATPQRLAIYQILYNTTTHPSAEHIYKSLQSSYPTMSLATVYKTLDILKKSHLIQELNVGEDSFRYDANISSHAHLICKTCQQVFDFHTTSFDQLIPNLQTETDFEITSKNLFFYGICANCQNKEA